MRLTVGAGTSRDLVTLTFELGQWPCVVVT